MRTEHKLELPRRLQIEFSQVIQHVTDEEGGEVSPEEMWSAFADEYLPTPDHTWGRFRLAGVRLDTEEDGDTTVVVQLRDRTEDTIVTLEGVGNGPIAAFCEALATYDVDVRVLDYAEHAMSAGGDAKAAAYLECAVGGRVLWGVGIDPSITSASLKAVVSAVNRALRTD
jgi:2-isopropylmalate synthase